VPKANLFRQVAYLTRSFPAAYGQALGFVEAHLFW
jgi:hypothetical protein